ncbi:Hint domain-containing protein [Roseovarius sp. EL26]|uniref:Hint domain-containing protein n=1 Tax=Roseovarius sp. EL26 TaxID=2126672 RepID=UPI0020B159E6|nr:Hint domain-containing protein [Roseovarius sp. EL26]
MPITTHVSAIYLGNLSTAIDPTEGNVDMEGADTSRGPNSIFQNQKFGSDTDPLHQKLVTISATSTDPTGKENDQSLHVDGDQHTDTLEYNLNDGNGVVESEFDAYLQWTNPSTGPLVNQVLVTYADGTIVSREIDIIQDDLGNLFLVFDGDRPSANDQLNSGEIVSIQFSGRASAYDGTSSWRREDWTPTSTEFHGTTMPCFVRGTKILTIRGPVEIENLKAGDLVWTADRGYQPIRWIGSRRLKEIGSHNADKVAPVLVSSGSIGQDMPDSDLLVSPQHRMLVSGMIAERMFGATENLASAKHLTDREGINTQTHLQQVEYFHMLFENHEIISANGALCESLFLGPEALKSLSEANRQEIFALFPDWDHTKDELPPNFSKARRFLGGSQTRKLVMRSEKNCKPLVARGNAAENRRNAAGRLSV